MVFALYFKPENTVSTFHVMKLGILGFSLQKVRADKAVVLILIHGSIFMFQALKILFV